MTITKFSPPPRVAESRMHSCGVAGHNQYQRGLVEQFDGSWKHSVCPACRWQALYNTPKEQDEYRAALADDMADDLNTALLATGITPRFRKCSFESYVTGDDQAKQRALNICRKYAEAFEKHATDGRALMLLGDIGCGKTHLACAILQHVVRHEAKTGLIVTAESITQAVSDSFRSKTGCTKSELIAELASVDLLVIDEVGFHTPKEGKDFTPSLLHEVIDARYQRVRPTVVVSNQTAATLHEFIGPRAADRLRENGGLLAPFTWASARSGGGA